MKVYQNQVLKNARVLFVQDGCEICLRWKKFIERFNLEIKPEKRIEVIDATNLSRNEIFDHPLLKIFDKYIFHFPVLFLDGRKIPWANSPEEAEAFVRSYLHEDFIIPQENPLLFEVKCRNVKRRFHEPQIVCENVE